MAKVVTITSDANFIEMDMKGSHNYLDIGKIRRSAIDNVFCLGNNQGVQIVCDGLKPVVLKHSQVDHVDGNNVTSDADLYAELKALM